MNPSERIDQLIAELTDWRGKTLASVRKTILGRPGDNRGMEVDGKPGVVSRRDNRGRQRPQREGEADLFPRGEPPGPRQALQRGLRRQGVASDRLFRRR